MSISAVYRTIAEQEATYRDKHFSADDILHDTMDHALSICFRKSRNNVEYQVLERGIKQVSSHIFSEPFHIEGAPPKPVRASISVARGRSRPRLPNPVRGSLSVAVGDAAAPTTP